MNSFRLDVVSDQSLVIRLLLCRWSIRDTTGQSSAILLSSSPYYQDISLNPPRPGQSVSDYSEMETGQGGAEAEEVTAQYEEYNGKVEEDELFIVQNGEPVSPHFTHKWDA